MTVQVEIKSETAAKLQAIAAALQLSLDGYLEKVAELVPLPEVTTTDGQAAVMTEARSGQRGAAAGAVLGALAVHVCLLPDRAVAGVG